MSIFIGIDPGDNCGWAKVRNGKLVELHTFQFWYLIEALENEFKLGAMYKDLKPIIVLEATYLNKPAWANKRTGKMIRNVGMNQQTAKLIRDFVQMYPVKLIEIRPNPSRATKMSAEAFNKITGWAGGSSEHSRDAALLVIGRMK